MFAVCWLNWIFFLGDSDCCKVSLVNLLAFFIELSRITSLWSRAGSSYHSEACVPVLQWRCDPNVIAMPKCCVAFIVRHESIARFLAFLSL